MTTYIRHATRAAKDVIRLDTPRTREVIGANLTAVHILDKSTGTFTLTFIFPDGTELELTDDEVSNSSRFEWDIKELLLTNAAQPGVTIKLLAEQQVM